MGSGSEGGEVRLRTRFQVGSQRPWVEHSFALPEGEGALKQCSLGLRRSLWGRQWPLHRLITGPRDESK